MDHSRSFIIAHAHRQLFEFNFMAMAHIALQEEKSKKNKNIKHQLMRTRLPLIAHTHTHRITTALGNKRIKYEADEISYRSNFITWPSRAYDYRAHKNEIYWIDTSQISNITKCTGCTCAILNEEEEHQHCTLYYSTIYTNTLREKHQREMGEERTRWDYYEFSESASSILFCFALLCSSLFICCSLCRRLCFPFFSVACISFCMLAYLLSPESIVYSVFACLVSLFVCLFQQVSTYFVSLHHATPFDAYIKLNGVSGTVAAAERPQTARLMAFGPAMGGTAPARSVPMQSYVYGVIVPMRWCISLIDFHH